MFTPVRFNLGKGEGLTLCYRQYVPLSLHWILYEQRFDFV